MDLCGHVLEPGAGPGAVHEDVVQKVDDVVQVHVVPGVVHGNVLGGEVGQPLQVHVHRRPVPVHARDLEVALEVSKQISDY